MRIRTSLYQMETIIAQYVPVLRPAQRRGLALWVLGTILAKSACQSAVVQALRPYGSAHALRQRLREWLYDGADKAAPCQTQVPVSVCFRFLLRWVLAWWRADTMALALDITLDRDRHAALVVSVLYRGTAIPVAWRIVPANTKGAWLPHLQALFRSLWRAVPRELTVLVLLDRGLWSPVLWRRIRRVGWHPLVRVTKTMTIQTDTTGGTGHSRVPGPGHAWVGQSRMDRRRARQFPRTMLVIWANDQREPWVLLTDLPPTAVNPGWYAMRMWIECGFRVLKRMGWQWERTRRTDPRRVARHWLVLAVATLWSVAVGTRVEDAERVGRSPSHLRRPPGPPPTRARTVSIVQLGLSWLHHLIHTRLWSTLWLWPDPWPEPPEGIQWVFDL